MCSCFYPSFPGATVAGMEAYIKYRCVNWLYTSYSHLGLHSAGVHELRTDVPGSSNQGQIAAEFSSTFLRLQMGTKSVQMLCTSQI